MTLQTGEPTIPVYEGLRQVGEMRLAGKHLENLICVQFRRPHEEWKDLLLVTAVGGQIAFRTFPNHTGKTKLYDPTTNTVSDLEPPNSIRDDSGVRTSKGG